MADTVPEKLGFYSALTWMTAQGDSVALLFYHMWDIVSVRTSELYIGNTDDMNMKDHTLRSKILSCMYNNGQHFTTSGMVESGKFKCLMPCLTYWNIVYTRQLH